MVFVVDTSVAIKWAMPEEDSDRALLILRDEKLFAPEIMDWEFCGAIVRSFRLNRISQEDSRIILQTWQNSFRNKIIWHSASHLTEKAMAAAFELKHDYYDCIFLALAIQNGVDLVTADKTFAQRALKIYPRVMLLEDYRAA